METLNKRRKLRIFLPIMFSGLLSSCAYLAYNELSKYEKGIQKPITDLDVPFNEFTFKAESGAFIKNWNGTSLNIEPNSFEFAEGRYQVSGDITIKYREFHKAIDIFKSGIPMNVTPDRNAFLQSGGMIEVKAFAQNKELKLKQGKVIKTKLAGFRLADGYNLYYLANNEKWEDKGDIDNGLNIRKKQEMDALPDVSKKPVNPEDDSTQIIFDLVSDFEEFPYLQAFKNQQWKMIKEDVDSTYPWGFRVNWEHVEVKELDKEKLIFELTFTNNAKKKHQQLKQSFITKATPVLSGARLKKAKREFLAKMEEYNKVSEFVKAEFDRLAQEADLINTFDMDKLGIWNCDKLIDKEIMAKVKMNFDFEKEINPYINKIKLYTILEDLNGVITYNAFDWNKVELPRGSKVKLIAVLPNNMLAVVSPDVVNASIKPGIKNVYFKTTRIKADAFFTAKTPISKKPNI